MKLTRSKRWAFFGLLTSLALWSALLIAVMNQQAITDWWRLRDYTPPEAIVQLADETTMTEKAQHIFYVYHPELQSSEPFNTSCRRGNEFTIVLGCYVSSQGIYIFDVNDNRLDGIEEVTAAHEMLHAAYERLSDKDRIDIDKMTAATFAKLNNKRLIDTLSLYEENDSKAVPSELYTILGTEVRNLPSELERHYAAYFGDRIKVVSLAEAYEKAFTDREEQIRDIEKEMTILKTQVKFMNETLAIEHTRLEEEYQRLESQRTSTDPMTFRSIATAYNNRVNAYNRQVTEVNELIEKYNAHFEVYESLVLEHQELFKAIDSRPQVISS